MGFSRPYVNLNPDAALIAERDNDCPRVPGGVGARVKELIDRARFANQVVRSTRRLV